MKKNIKKICNYKYTHLIIILIALLSSVLLELTIGNKEYYFHDFKGTQIEENIIYEKEKDQYIVRILNVNKFVNELKLDVKVNLENNIDYISYYSKDALKDIPIYQETLYSKQDTSSIIRIKKEVEELKLVFNNCDEKNIQIKSVTSMNQFEINFAWILVLFAIIYFLLDIPRIYFKEKKPKLYQYFLKVSLIIGTLYAFLNPMYFSLDEKEHMLRSYNLAQGNFIKQKGDMVKFSPSLSDIIEYPYNIYVPNTYAGFQENIKYLTELGSQEEQFAVHNSTAEPYVFPAYLISGIGMLIGRILNLSFPLTFYLGRIFNVIFYSILVAFAIKLSGKYSKLFFLIGSLPYFLFQSGSYSADMLTNAMSILVFGLVLYYRSRERKVGFKETVYLLGACTLTYISKVAYFPIVFSVLLIPKEQFKTPKLSTLTKILIPLSGILGFGLCTFYANRIGIVQWPMPGVNTKEQMSFILHNPIQYLYIIYTTFQTGLTGMLVSATSQLGYCGELGNIHYFLILGSFIFVCATSSDAEKITVWNKVVLFVLIGLCIGASITALYLSFNAVGSPIVNGYQGRYLAPLLLPSLLLLCSKKFKLEIKPQTAKYITIAIALLLNLYAIVKILRRFYF